MPYNYVVTYDIDTEKRGAQERQELVQELEDILDEYDLEPEFSNQTTYFGECSKKPRKFIKTLLEEIEVLEDDLNTNDAITIYFPRASDGNADIGKYQLKKEGERSLNKEIQRRSD
jgi:hypothetical protein